MFKKLYISIKKAMKKLKTKASTENSSSNRYDGTSEEELFFNKSDKQNARANQFRRASVGARREIDL